MRKTLEFWGRTINFVVGGRIDDNNQHRWSTPTPSAPTVVLDLLNPAPVYDPGLIPVKNRDVYTHTKNAYTEALIRLTSKLMVVGAVRVDRISNHRMDAAGVDTFKEYSPVTGRYGLVYTLIPNLDILYRKQQRHTADDTIGEYNAQFLCIQPAADKFLGGRREDNRI